MEQSKQGPPPAYQQEPWSDPEQEIGHGGSNASLKGHPPVLQQPQPQPPPIYYQAAYQQQQRHPNYGVYGVPGTVYVAQQQMIVEPPPPNYSLLSWFTCMCCCWPLGIIAILKSLDVDSAVRSGDTVRARKSSESAKKFALLALLCGIFFAMIWFSLWIVWAREFMHHRHHRDHLFDF